MGLFDDPSKSGGLFSKNVNSGGIFGAAPGQQYGTSTPLDELTQQDVQMTQLAQNEGIVVRNRTVWPAAGTGILTVLLGWAEVTAF